MRTNTTLRCDVHYTLRVLSLVCSAIQVLLLLGGLPCMWSTQSPAAVLQLVPHLPIKKPARLPVRAPTAPAAIPVALLLFIVASTPTAPAASE
jgi:hypothetical protein